ncbi:MAG: putative toxin-antitoxin system toxin component, PIN family [Candidatus Berkelbacteria bacterium]|nr:putative toxin-antitoxin system toxin component, PIN family [Candidatus Berkelbacteria bacterium]
MKIVLDTNILVSAFAVGGNPARILDLVVNGEVDGATSEHLISELTRILGAKFEFDGQQVSRIENIIRTTFTVVESNGSPPAISRDPDDDHVLELAKSAEANFIVSGDKDLLILGRYLGISITTAKDFLAEITDTIG